MIRHHFEYVVPDDVAGAFGALAAAAAPEVIAGGTWVVPQMTDGTRSPDVVIDTAGSAGIGYRSTTATS